MPRGKYSSILFNEQARIGKAYNKKSIGSNAYSFSGSLTNIVRLNKKEPSIFEDKGGNGSKIKTQVIEETLVGCKMFVMVQ